VLYEAPHRIEETMVAARDTLGGERRVLIARELTKLHETLHRCTLAEGPDWLAADANRRRGEFVLVIEGAPQHEEGTDEGRAAAHDTLLRALLDELPVSAAARVAARVTGVPRGALYSRALALGAGQEDEEER
jgi:16S rRNA (cytidine1402-2'-O)-methyltransferase